MVSALDTILDHIQKDPPTKHLFHDNDSETSTIIENPLPNTQPNQDDSTKSAPTTDNVAQMTIKEHSGTKRQHLAGSPTKHTHEPDPKNTLHPANHLHQRSDLNQINPPPTLTTTIRSGGDRNVANNIK
jgi:hypothetical protein